MIKKCNICQKYHRTKLKEQLKPFLDVKSDYGIGLLLIPIAIIIYPFVKLPCKNPYCQEINYFMDFTGKTKEEVVEMIKK